MIGSKMLLPKVAIVAVATLALLGAALAITILATPKPNSASAAAPRSERFGIAAAPLQQTAVFTDAYEGNAPYNDSSNTASQLGLATCSVATPISSLTLYRANLNPPASDIDYYYVSASPQRIVSVTVSLVGTTNSLSTLVQLLDPNFQIAGQATASLNQPVALSAYSLNGGRYTIKVEAANKSLAGTEAMPYSLLICQSDANVTATPTAPGNSPDGYEPNDSPALAQQFNKSFLVVGTDITNLNFYTSTTGTQDMGDVDWMFFYVKQGLTYQVTTSTTLGVDTELFVYRGDKLPPDNKTDGGGLLGRNDDYLPMNRSSRVTFTSPIQGLCWVKVWNLDQTPRVAGQLYSVRVDELPTRSLVFLPLTRR